MNNNISLNTVEITSQSIQVVNIETPKVNSADILENIRVVALKRLEDMKNNFIRNGVMFIVSFSLGVASLIACLSTGNALFLCAATVCIAVSSVGLFKFVASIVELFEAVSLCELIDETDRKGVDLVENLSNNNIDPRLLELLEVSNFYLKKKIDTELHEIIEVTDFHVKEETIVDNHESSKDDVINAINNDKVINSDNGINKEETL